MINLFSQTFGVSILVDYTLYFCMNRCLFFCSYTILFCLSDKSFLSAGKPNLKTIVLCNNEIATMNDDCLLDLSEVVKLDLRQNPINVLPKHWKVRFYVCMFLLFAPSCYSNLIAMD